jgi:hypothetical protein
VCVHDAWKSTNARTILLSSYISSYISLRF